MLAETLKQIFPKPNLPQKRYLLLLGTIIYFALKIYVASTPQTYDDLMLEKAHDIAIQLIADNDDIVAISDYEIN